MGSHVACVYYGSDVVMGVCTGKEIREKLRIRIGGAQVVGRPRFESTNYDVVYV